MSSILINDQGRGNQTSKHATRNPIFPQSPDMSSQTARQTVNDDSNYEPGIEDIAFVRSMKEKFKGGVLDLLNKKTHQLMVDIYEKEMNKEMLKQVNKFKQKQEEQREYQKRCQQSKYNLFPRSSKSIVPMPSKTEVKKELALRAMRTYNNSRRVSQDKSEGKSESISDNSEQEDLFNRSFYDTKPSVLRKQTELRIHQKLSSSILSYQSNTPKYHQHQENIIKRIKPQGESPKYKKLMKTPPDDYGMVFSSPITPSIQRDKSAYSRNAQHVNEQLQSTFTRQVNKIQRFQTPKPMETLPNIDFHKVNKLRVGTLQNGTGKHLREELIKMGGASKFYRTRRQNMLINKPNTMFENTMFSTSAKVQNIWNPITTSRSLIRDMDTSFCENYDEPGVPNVILGGMSMEQKSILSPSYDHKYSYELEGTSAHNIKRKFQFTQHIDHLQNPNKVINEKMEDFFRTTRSPAIPCIRDTRLDQASKELERQQIKILRANRLFKSSSAYNEELELKKQFFAEIKKKYPLIDFKLLDIHSMTYSQMKTEIANRIQAAKILGAVQKIQRFFRKYILKKNLWEVYILKHNAAKMIQRNFKSTKWVRLLNQLIKNNQWRRITNIQKYCRGYMARKKVFDLMKYTYLTLNFEYMDKIKEKLLTDFQILMRYVWLKKKKILDEKKRKKAEAEEAKKNAKNKGRRNTIKK